jgi:predicted aspartyl protease
LIFEFSIDPDGRQFQDFINKAGSQFKLKAKGEKAVSAIGYEIGKYIINGRKLCGLWLSVDNRVKIKTDLPYELNSKKPNKNYRWIIKGPITFINLSEVEFGNYVTPKEGVLTQGKPIGLSKEIVVPFSSIANLISVKVRINDSEEEYRFIVDTGAEFTVISDQVATELKLEKKSEMTISGLYRYGAKPVDIVQIDRLSIGEMAIENCGALVMDLQAIGFLKFDGLIGANFLKFFCLKIDYQNQLLTFNPDKSPYQSAVKIGLIPKNGIITTMLKIGSSEENVIIDTGLVNSYLTIPLKFLEEYQPVLNSPLIKSKGTTGSGLIGQSESAISRISTIQLGDFILRDLPVDFTNTNTYYMGNRFLSHFTVIIDYPAMEMGLIPNTQKKWENNIFSYGLSIRKNQAGMFQVMGVLEGSPADLAGLLAGDEIIKIYDEVNTELPLDKLIEFIFAEKDYPLKLLVKNSQGEREVRLNKAKLLSD